MNKELSDSFRQKTKYDSQEIGGVLGLKNAGAGDLLYYVAPKDIGLIQPPYMPNIRFSKFTLTNELICLGSFGVDPDNFKVANPTFFIHKSQIESYCKVSEQEMILVNPMYFPYSNQPEDTDTQQQPTWTKDVSQPLLYFLSNIEDKQIYSEVPEEMLTDLSTPKNNERMTDFDKNN